MIIVWTIISHELARNPPAEKVHTKLK